MVSENHGIDIGAGLVPKNNIAGIKIDADTNAKDL